jgi:hypothetical protein
VVNFMAIALWPCYTPEVARWFRELKLGSVRRVAVLFAAGGKQNRHNKDGNNHGDDEEWGSNVHRAGSLLLFRVANQSGKDQQSEVSLQPFCIRLKAGS